MKFQPKTSKTLFASGLIALSLMLASCGGSSSSDPEPAADQPSVIPPNPLDPISNPTTPTTPTTPEVPTGPQPTDPTGLIVSVTSGDVQGDYFTGAPPQTVGSVTLNALTEATDPITVISGGSLELPVVSDIPFSTIFVNSDAAGYFQLLLPEATNSASAIVSYNTDLAASTSNQVNVAVQTPTGDVSSSQMLPLETLEVGTGDVQVSVQWFTPTDVDIWLIEPSGNRIYWGEPQSASGGELDLDSNPACFLDNINNENITYEGVTPPSGEYTVVVDYFDNCGVAGETSYVVTVRANGSIDTFDGELSAGDTEMEVTTFIIP